MLNLVMGGATQFKLETIITKITKITRAGQSGVPVGFGLLTCPTLEHARARAGGEHGNKGADTMTAVLCSVNTIESLPTTEVEQ